MSTEDLRYGVQDMIRWLEDHGSDFPSLTDVSDVTMVLTCLRHLKRRLESQQAAA